VHCNAEEDRVEKPREKERSEQSDDNARARQLKSPAENELQDVEPVAPSARRIPISL